MKIFNSTSIHDGAPGYRERSGQEISVIRQLNEKECDIECGPMFKVAFTDGVMADVFDFEIEEV